MTIQLADEVPATEIPAIPKWSENYCFVAFDPGSELGLWIHLGRWQRDPRLWREQVIAFLPDGSFGIHRSHGGRPVDDGVAGPGLEILIDEPGRALRLRFAGSARTTTAAEIANLPLPAAPLDLLRLELAFESAEAIWDFGSSLAAESWASFHFEQPGRLTGSLKIGDHEFNLDTIGYRDHSRGPRDLSSLASSTWLQGHFPGERSFAVCATRHREDAEVVENMAGGMIFESGRAYPARISAAPYLSSPFEPAPSAYKLSLESELGTMEVEAETVSQICSTTDAGFESFTGLERSLGVRVLIEAPTRFTWEGRSGVGWTTRGSTFQGPR